MKKQILFYFIYLFFIQISFDNKYNLFQLFFSEKINDSDQLWINIKVQ
jgi:hypothetical protein